MRIQQLLPALATLMFVPIISVRLVANDSIAPKIEGTWKWSFTMPDGSRTQPQAKLRRDGNILTGISIPRSGFETPIVGGKIAGNSVNWVVVREQDGRRVTTRYSGTVEGSTLKGTIESDWSGRIETYPWEAKRASDSPAGTWRWEFTFGGGQGRGRSFATQAVLKFDGQDLTGVVKGRSGDIEIRDATFKDGNIAFEVVRERGESRTVTRYWGKLDGDTIIGKSETEFGNSEPRSVKWEATRISE